MPHVLVAYATKHGSTAEIAQEIGRVLEDAGLEVTVEGARHIRDLSPYDAVIVGSALYSAHWQRDANRFVKRHAEALTARPVWLFSSGPLDRSADFDDIPMTVHVEAEVASIRPRGHRTFGGRLLPDTPGVPEEMLATHRVGDFRNWDQIRDWAREIARAVGAVGAVDAAGETPGS
jgi:menaquinone-dependent protoporphyrinogen oxidase